MLSAQVCCRIRLAWGWVALRRRALAPAGEHARSAREGRLLTFAQVRDQLRAGATEVGNRARLRALLRQSGPGVDRWSDTEVTAEILRRLAAGRLEAVLEAVVPVRPPRLAERPDVYDDALGPLPEDLRRLRGRARAASEPARIRAVPRAAVAPAKIAAGARASLSSATMRGGVRGGGEPARVAASVRGGGEPARMRGAAKGAPAGVRFGGAARGPTIPTALEDEGDT